MEYQWVPLLSCGNQEDRNQDYGKVFVTYRSKPPIWDAESETDMGQWRRLSMKKKRQ
jgi:hypothetical protein